MHVAHCASSKVAWVMELGLSPSGNLCRCTGYRPIIDTCKTFCTVSWKECIIEYIFSPRKQNSWGVKRYKYRATSYLLLLSSYCCLPLGRVLALSHQACLLGTWWAPKHFGIGCGSSSERSFPICSSGSGALPSCSQQPSVYTTVTALVPLWCHCPFAHPSLHQLLGCLTAEAVHLDGWSPYTEEPLNICWVNK